MRKFLIAISWLMGSLCLCHIASAQLITAQRTHGTAPLGIHFSINSHDWDTLINNDYEWHFPNGDTSIGFQVVHTFMESGWVKLKKTTPTFHAMVDSIYITVTGADDAYAGTATHCIATDGDFTGCPSGATLHTLDNLNSLTFNAHHRYLFKAGDTFDLSMTKALPVGLQLNRFGMDASFPVIQIQGDAMHTVFWMNDSISISNLHFYGHQWTPSASWSGTQYGEGRLLAPEHHTTIYKVKVSNMTTFAIMDDGIGARNNLVIDQVEATNLGSYFVYAGPSPSMQYSGVKDVSVRNVLSNHGIRMNGGQWFTVMNAHFDSVERSHITFRGLHYGVVSDSKFTGKGLYKNSVRNIWDDASTTDSVQYILFERNVYHTRANEFGIDLNIGKHIHIRNNIFINASLNIGENLAGVIPQNVGILHNTFYNAAYDWYATITLRTGGSGYFQGNLVYVDNCSSVDCITENPFSSYSSQNPSQWHLNYNAYYNVGDPSGAQFKGALNFATWKALGWESNSKHLPFTLEHMTTIIDEADYTPTHDSIINAIPFQTHRDHHAIRRLTTVMSDIGAVENETILGGGGMGISSSADLDFNIFPNPTSNYLHIFGNHKIHAIMIYDMHGKIMMSQQQGSIIEISHLPAGNYIIEIFTEKYIKLQKSFIKQ